MPMMPPSGSLASIYDRCVCNGSQQAALTNINSSNPDLPVEHVHSQHCLTCWEVDEEDPSQACMLARNEYFAMMCDIGEPHPSFRADCTYSWYRRELSHLCCGLRLHCADGGLPAHDPRIVQPYLNPPIRRTARQYVAAVKPILQ